MKGYRTVLLNASKLDKLQKRLQDGCGKCEFEEADGSLYCHCADCRLAVTKLAYDLFEDAQRKHMEDHHQRRAACGEEPVRSPSVDASEAKDKSDARLTITLSLDTTHIQMELKRLAETLAREFPIR